MTPTEYYQRLITSDQILADDQQHAVIEHLQTIYDQLIEPRKKSSFLSKLTGQKQPAINGLYLWGDIGIGKTFLMDCFFYCLPFKNKMRIHFHKFMKMIHEQLTLIQGENNPLEKIAKKIAKEAKVICFDELLVNDITDAMLLAGLFEALYKENICLLFTSNTAPDNLYLNGIQRISFLPAIDLIKKNSTVINITSHRDYRYKDFHENNFYYFPLTASIDQKLEQLFIHLSNKSEYSQKQIQVLDREIKVRKVSDNVVWLDFLDICGIPRNQNDYIAIANIYRVIMVSNVTVIPPEHNDLIRSFINLIDVLYDSNRRLIISAEKPIEEIYLSGRMLFEFARTRSRIAEMQTLSWQKKCETVD